MLLRRIFSGSPVAVRVVPFLVFVLLTVTQGACGPGSTYWFYLLKTLVGLWLVCEIWPLVPEMRWAFSVEAVVVGVGVFVLWVAIGRGWATQNVLWVKLGVTHSTAAPPASWNPHARFGSGSALGWLFILTRILGSSLVVPPLEEVFYRSFLYRYIARVEFLSVPLNRFLPWPFLATALVFGFSHNEWLAGILCAMAYQWLVLRKNCLGDAMTAHAITNFLLGLWVVWQGAWNFW